MDLAAPIGSLPSVGHIYKHRLEKLAIYTIKDLLFHFPFRYDDFSIISKIANLQEGEVVTVQGKIKSIKNEFTRGRKFIQKAVLEDDTDEIEIVWFNQTFLTRTIPPGTMVSLSGKVETFKRNLAMVSPQYEIAYLGSWRETIHTGRLVPVYPETYGVSSKWLRNKIYQLLTMFKNELREYLPADIINKYDLIPFDNAIQSVHFPLNNKDAQKARERLAFDEFFIMQLQNNVRKKEWEQRRIGRSLGIAGFKNQIQQFWQRLPFELTNGQKRAVREIFADLAKPRAMNRLLEGDVGSGKTVVSAIGMYITFLNGFQSVLMAPTQILAQQHYDTISKLLAPLGLKAGLITGGKGGKEKSSLDIFVGTHALLSEKLTFEKLAFIVIDEQHRFGVEQRGLLLKKSTANITPHILTMTATPIPRTVALTMYGNLDISYLDEMPRGRTPVKTWAVQSQKREAAYTWVKEKIKKEHAQVFIVCPFIEESESMVTVKAATKEYERLRKEVFTQDRLGLLHGKMKAREKEKAIEDFRNRIYDVLVATPVVDVGIDIPGATIIIIEGSERFGLAALHQLRGRVGRRDIQSYCLLFTQTESLLSLRRLKNLEKIQVGAQLAQLDLVTRGPGELTGTRQHGVPGLKIASFSDLALIDKTGKEAQGLLLRDPGLKTAPLLKEMLKTYTIQNVEPN